MYHYHVTTLDSLISIEQSGYLFPTIGPRSLKFKESIPMVYAFKDYQALSNSNWIWDEFDDDEHLFILHIQNSILFACAERANPWEVSSSFPVPKHLIKSVQNAQTDDVFDSIEQALQDYPSIHC